MRPPARHRNGYHRTVTKSQRRNRWQLYLASALLVLGANRCAVGCHQVKHAEQPGQWAAR